MADQADSWVAISGAFEGLRGACEATSPSPSPSSKPLSCSVSVAPPPTSSFARGTFTCISLRRRIVVPVTHLAEPLGVDREAVWLGLSSTTVDAPPCPPSAAPSRQSDPRQPEATPSKRHRGSERGCSIGSTEVQRDVAREVQQVPRRGTCKCVRAGSTISQGSWGPRDRHSSTPPATSTQRLASGQGPRIQTSDAFARCPRSALLPRVGVGTESVLGRLVLDDLASRAGTVLRCRRRPPAHGRGVPGARRDPRGSGLRESRG